jgi:hypothetical protein
MKRTRRFIALLAFTLVIENLIAFPNAAAAQEPLSILSAYYGLHAALPIAAQFLCRGGVNKDGMPVILSHTIDVATLPDE